jgi:hypothetical protein
LDDQSTDSESLVVKFGSIELKCDIYERILAPEDFDGYPEAICANGIVKDTGKAVTNVPIYKLIATKAVKISGVCDSLIYGSVIYFIFLILKL